MTAADPISTPPRGPLRQNLLIGVLSVLAGAVVIPYGASMPYIREGIPGPGLFPMMIGGLLILFGVLLPLSTWIGARREGRRRHRAGAGGGAVGTVPAPAGAPPRPGTGTGPRPSPCPGRPSRTPTGTPRSRRSRPPA